MASIDSVNEKISATIGFNARFCLICLLFLSHIGIYTAVAQSDTGLPIFLTEPDNVTVEEGRTAKLHCSVNFLKQNQVVAWMKEDSFQTSGRDILVNDKFDRFSIQKDTYEDHLEFHLRIKNATYADAGAYLCYIVEFGDLNQRRWRKSRTASITVIERWVKPKLKCFNPPDIDADGFVTTENSVAVGCSVREAEWSRSLELQQDGVSVLTDYAEENATVTTLRKIRYRIRPVDGEIFEGTFTCAMYYSLRDGSVETDTCTIGTLRVRRPPPTPTPTPEPVYYDDENSLWVKPGEHAILYCPQKTQESSDGRRLAWTIYPPLPPSRYIFKHHGSELSITNVSKSDSGLLVTCVIYSEKSGRKDLETTIRIGEKPPKRNDPKGNKPASSISSNGPNGNAGRKLVLPDMSNPDWKLLQSKWNGLRHEADIGFIHEISVPEERESVTVINTPREQETTTVSINNPAEILTTEAGSNVTSKPDQQFNESIYTGPPLNIRDLLPQDILRNDESRFGKTPSLFTGLILMCTAAMITVLLLGLTVGLRCRTKREPTEKEKPDISDPIPLSLPERCITDSTYEEMHSNLKNFPAHASVAGPPGVTMLEPRYLETERSSCNSELVFGSNQVDFTIDFPVEHVYGGSLPPPNLTTDVTFDLENLPPDMKALYSDRVCHQESMVKAEPIYNASQAYFPLGSYPCNRENISEAIIVNDPEYAHELTPQSTPPDAHRQHHQRETNPKQENRSSNGSDPYKFEPLQPNHQNQKPLHIINPAFGGLTRVDSNASSNQDFNDPDYLPPRVTSWYYQKGSPPQTDQTLHQQPPYGLYEVL